MNNKKLLVFSLAACLMLSFTGCGNEKTNTVDDNKTAVVEETENISKEDSENTSYEITDMLGRKVSIPVETSSYACIGPGALRLYCYVADSDKLAGVEDSEQSWGSGGRPYNMSIENINELPVIGPGGPGNAPDAEMLFIAKPDVIFTTYNSEVSSVDELQEKTEIPVVAISYGKGRLFDETLYKSFELIGKVTGNDKRAKEVIDYFENAKADLNSRTENQDKKVRTYLGCQSHRGSHGIESTTGDYAIFDAINAENVVKEAGIDEYIMLDKEKLLDMDPEVIILDAGGLALLKEDYNANPEYYKSFNAFKNNKAYLQMPFNYYSTNMEIALADAYYIGSVLYPEAFKDVDPATKFDEISNFFLGIDSYDKIASEYYGGYQKVNLDEL